MIFKKRHNSTTASPVQRAKECIGSLTPLKGHDCGRLCNAACCCGDEQTGMLLFPGEESTLRVDTLADGSRLAVCSGTCTRQERPLACMIFPFFPTVDENGKIYAEIDARAYHICPLAQHSDEVLFDRAFIRAVRKVGQILAKDERCLAFMRDVTAQIDELEHLRGSQE